MQDVVPSNNKERLTEVVLLCRFVAAAGNCLLHALQFHGFGQRLGETIGVDAVADAGHVCPHIACSYSPQSFIYLTIILQQHSDASARRCIDILSYC